MNVASLELCRELYELSGWDEPVDSGLQLWAKIDGSGNAQYQVWHPNRVKGDSSWRHMFLSHPWYPAYDLGYLLRKLPKHIESSEACYELRMMLPFTSDWRFDYFSQLAKVRLLSDFHGNSGCIGVDNTPEDAAAKLAIELFEQGVLTRETSDGR